MKEEKERRSKRKTMSSKYFISEVKNEDDGDHNNRTCRGIDLYDMEREREKAIKQMVNRESVNKHIFMCVILYQNLHQYDEYNLHTIHVMQALIK